MSLQSKTILHNKLETASGTISSAIGPDFVVNAGTPDSQAMKFNNGLQVDADSEDVKIPSGNLDSNFNTTEGFIHGWVKIPYNIVDGKQDDDVTWHTWFDVFDSGENIRLQIAWNKINGLYWIMRENGSVTVWTSTDPRLDIPADTWFLPGSNRRNYLPR